MEFPRDVAATRLDNALLLFDEFVRATVKHADAATLRGLERRFAERLQIQASYWSQIKSRSRQIGERLARQFEQLCHKPYGWMDEPHGGGRAALGATPAQAPADDPLPQDDDERFIVGLVLTYYRRHPQRARTRLLDLLGEVLMPAAPASPAAPSTAQPAPASAKSGTAQTPAARSGARAAKPPAGADAASADDAHALWLNTQRGVAPLKKKPAR